MIADYQLVSGGILLSISLIMTLSIAEIMVESERWNKSAETTLAMCNTPFLIVFFLIVINKILMVL